jgi:hypothetical protein
MWMCNDMKTLNRTLTHPEHILILICASCYSFLTPTFWNTEMSTRYFMPSASYRYVTCNITLRTSCAEAIALMSQYFRSKRKRCVAPHVAISLISCILQLRFAHTRLSVHLSVELRLWMLNTRFILFGLRRFISWVCSQTGRYPYHFQWMFECERTREVTSPNEIFVISS